MRSTIINDWKDYGNKSLVNFRLGDFGVNSGFRQFSLCPSHTLSQLVESGWYLPLHLHRKISFRE